MKTRLYLLLTDSFFSFEHTKSTKVSLMPNFSALMAGIITSGIFNPHLPIIICELFWTDIEPEKALVNLQTTIYLIRKMLE